MSADKDVPGNVLATHSRMQREAMKLAGAIDMLEHVMNTDDERDPWLEAVRIKMPTGENDEFLMVLTGDSADGAVVAFHAATSLREVIRGGFERYINKSLKWRPDEYRRS